MDSQRNILFVAFIMVSFLLWTSWERFTNPPPVIEQATQQVVSSNTSPEAINGSEAVVNGRSQAQSINVVTDVLSLKINTLGGDINAAKLLTYKATLNSSEPLQLMESTPTFVYQAQSGLIGTNGIDVAGRRPVYSVAQKSFTLPDGQNELRVPMTYRAANGVVYTKTFIFKRGHYDIGVEYTVNNPTNSSLNVVMFGQLKQTVNLSKERETSKGSFGMHVYRGAAYSTDETKYKKYSFSDIEDGNLNLETKGGWVGMLQHYFATAWIPSQDQTSSFYSSNLSSLGQAAIGFRTQPILIEPKSNKTINASLWIGPEIQDQMAAVAPHLDLSVDYGWLWFISQPLFKLLKFIHSFVGNWGVSIILITFIVRGVMYPLTKAQYTSMAKMKLLQPRIQAMRERLGDDKQRMSQEMMALYKQEKVNPLGGCFPIIIQMPIFLALFYMLGGSVELRHAPFAFWLHDLSAQDPYYILPLLMGGTMFLIQKMSPTPVADPMQQKIMTFMPVIFTCFFLWFPSGLVLYYIMSNLVTIAQQQLIYRGLEKRGLHTRKKKKS